MEKYIEKKYTIEDDIVIISLTDLRDSYINPNALGNIGTINLSYQGVFIYPSLGHDANIDRLKERKLCLAFKEIFGQETYDSLSPKCYQTIKEMIKDGSLEALGYEKETEIYDEDIIPKYHNKH